MPYEPMPGDKDAAPGQLAAEAVNRLKQRPDLTAKLRQFVDMWGLDGYDPFGPDGCSAAVRQIVLVALVDAGQ